MLNFIINYWLIILIAFVIVVGVIVLLRMGYTKQIKACMLYLVIEAEKQYGGGTGTLKYSAVSTWIYEKLPAFARIFISAKLIDTLIENAVTAMKKYLEENQSAKAVVETYRVVQGEVKE